MLKIARGLVVFTHYRR